MYCTRNRLKELTTVLCMLSVTVSIVQKSLEREKTQFLNPISSTYGSDSIFVNILMEFL